MIYKQEIDFLHSAPYDVLIVGGGAVGLSLATSLSYDKINICVVESGLENYNLNFDKLKHVETDKLSIKSNSRERMLGGCGQTWKGLITNFDKCDLFDRGHRYPALGIDQNEIQILLDKFGKFFQIPESSNFDPSKYPNSYFDLGCPFEKKVFLKQNKVFKFGDRLKNIFDRPRTNLILGWTVSNLKWEGSTCKGVEIQNIKGEKKYLYAKHIILCCGTIETVRLLKLSQLKGEIPKSLPIGKYFKNHPKGIIGKIKLNKSISSKDPVIKLPYKKDFNFTGYIGLRFNDEYIFKNKLSNVCIQIIPKKNSFFNISSSNFAKVVKNFPGISRPEIFRWFVKLILAFWKFRDGIFGLFYQIIFVLFKKEADIKIFTEISNEEENQISLINDKKNKGKLIPHVSYSLSNSDINSIKHLLKELQKTFLKKRIGKLIFLKKNLEELVKDDSSHHMGGAIISLNDDGVTTQKFKVISSENLFICGGSLLRSSGYANPTMTFIGMALKLGKHIKGLLQIPRNKKSFFELNSKLKKNFPEIIIIGAGKRVREDVLPVFESIIKDPDEISVYAKHESGIFGRSQALHVKSINDLTKSDLKKTKLIYVAIPIIEAIKVSKKLKQIVPDNVKIIWDTPISNEVLDGLNILDNYQKFVAEDSSYLPWLELIESQKETTLKQILIDKGGFLYHATAFVSEIQKRINGHDSLQKTNIKRSRTKLKFNFKKNVSVIINLKRSYKEGKIKLFFENKSEIVLGGDGRNSNIKIIRNKLGQCTGFSMGNKIHKLSKIETNLMGYFHNDDDIVTKMLEIKRVGLRRLILDIYNNKSKLEIADAYSDANLFNPSRLWKMIQDARNYLRG